MTVDARLRPAFRLRPHETLEERWRRLAPHLQVARPNGEGPFPALLMFHGCGGRRSFLSRYMEAATAAGVMAVSVDSFAARGIGRARALALVCTGLELPGWQRAGDVLASVWGVSRLPDVDPERVVLAGWSHGGWSIMDLMTMPLERPGEAGLADPDSRLLDRLKGLFLVYPYCGPGALSQIRPWRRGADIYAVLAERDSVAVPPLIRRALRKAERAGSTVESWLAPGATHAYDEDGAAISRFRFDPALARETEARLQAYLRRRI